ncbi:MAG: flagellar biosynthesis protein FlaG [Methylotenera sp.]|uniref:flagellar protein FlaG n=1 Tax=Methylotenera sp. TaxID=2051956 RepID=UPI000D423CC6|nr:flagellar protein FlaG [Methylotenera sp.]PPC81871.1 MAG: flagellar biosynthesis protein FlaG [Methylotenera sp.]
MFNSSLGGYGAIKNTAAVQNIAGGQNAISGPAITKSVEKIEAVRPDTRQAVEVDKAALSNAVTKLNELVAPALQAVQFKIDEDSERVIVQVVDTATDKVLRQIPNEEVLAFSKTLGRLQGLVVREQA